MLDRDGLGATPQVVQFQHGVPQLMVHKKGRTRLLPTAAWRDRRCGRKQDLRHRHLRLYGVRNEAGFVGFMVHAAQRLFIGN
jgi:hypothetical protein